MSDKNLEIKRAPITPGKWSPGIMQSDTVISDNPGAAGSEYYGGDVICESVKSDADRHLIAAAPSMLKVLESIVKAADKGNEPDEILGPDEINELRYLIKRAHGL